MHEVEQSGTPGCATETSCGGGQAGVRTEWRGHFGFWSTRSLDFSDPRMFSIVCLCAFGCTSMVSGLLRIRSLPGFLSLGGTPTRGKLVGIGCMGFESALGFLRVFGPQISSIELRGGRCGIPEFGLNCVFIVSLRCWGLGIRLVQPDLRLGPRLLLHAAGILKRSRKEDRSKRSTRWP